MRRSFVSSLGQLTTRAIGSLIPALGLLLFDWEAFAVALAVWLDNTVKVVFGALQTMALPRAITARLLIAVTLTVFWGGFLAGHLVAIIFLLLPNATETSLAGHLTSLLFDWTWLLVLALLVFCYGMEYARVFLKPTTDRRAVTELLYQEVRIRVILVQLTVLGIAFLMEGAKIGPAAGLAFALLIKSASDVFFEYRRLQIPAMAGVRVDAV